MKLFIDENARIELGSHLGRIYPKLTFRTFLQEKLSGTLDPDLLPILRRRHFDVIITGDEQQLTNEREALRDARLHWVGIKVQKTDGLTGLATAIATGIAGFPHALELIRAAPTDKRCAILLRGVERESRQRINDRGWV